MGCGRPARNRGQKRIFPRLIASRNWRHVMAWGFIKIATVRWLALVLVAATFVGCMPDERTEEAIAQSLAAAAGQADGGSLGDGRGRQPDKDLGRPIDTVDAEADEVVEVDEVDTEMTDVAEPTPEVIVDADDAEVDTDASVAEIDTPVEIDLQPDVDTVDDAETDNGGTDVVEPQPEVVVAEVDTDALVVEIDVVLEDVPVEIDATTEVDVQPDVDTVDSTETDNGATDVVEPQPEVVVAEVDSVDTAEVGTDATVVEIDVPVEIDVAPEIIDVVADEVDVPPDLPKEELPPPDLCIGKICDDANSCTTDSCTSATGVCVHTPPVGGTKPCDDGNACTVSDVCSATGVCVAGSAKSCVDSDACTSDACDPKTGCVFAANWVKYTYDPIAPLPAEWTWTVSMQTHCSSYAKDSFNGQCGLGVKNLPPGAIEFAVLDLTKFRVKYKVGSAPIRLTFLWAHFVMTIYDKQSWGVYGADGNILEPKASHYGVLDGEGVVETVDLKSLGEEGVKLRFEEAVGKIGMKPGPNLWGPLLIHPVGCAPPVKL